MKFRYEVCAILEVVNQSGSNINVQGRRQREREREKRPERVIYALEQSVVKGHSGNKALSCIGCCVAYDNRASAKCYIQLLAHLPMPVNATKKKTKTINTCHPKTSRGGDDSKLLVAGGKSGLGSCGQRKQSSDAYG